MANRIFYYDVLKSDVYDVQGNLIGNNNVSVYLDNLDNIEMHYIIEPSGSDPTTWTKWTALAGLPTIASSVAVDDNVKHAIRGTTNAVITSLTTTIQAVVEETTVVNPTGNLQITDNAGVKYTFPYTSRTAISDTLYEFTVTNPLTTETIPSGCVVRIPEALLMKAEGADIDESDASTGVFVFKLYALSYKILESLDYSDSESISARLQHKIMSGGNTLYTFEFTYEIKNLIDFGNEAEVPAVETDTYATKAYVISTAVRPPEYEYSVDGVSGWHSALEAWDDIYYHIRPSGSGGSFSAAQIIPYGETGQTGATGASGLSGEDGLSVLFASGAPASGTGAEGDSYIDGETFDFYNKSSNAWSKIGNLVGATGATGASGLSGEDGSSVLFASGTPASGTGADGDSYIDGETFDFYNKSSGIWNVVGSLKGLDGTDGDNGLGYIPKGAWSSETTYDANDSVTYQGSFYASLQNTNLNQNPASETTYWLLLVSKGASGNSGIDGDDGSSVLFASGTPASGTGADGDSYIDGETFDFYNKSSGIWNVVGSLKGADGAAGADGDMVNPMTAQGDIIYGGVSGSPERLLKGTSGQLLKMNSEATAPEWGTIASVISAHGQAYRTTAKTIVVNTWSDIELDAHSEMINMTHSTSTDTHKLVASVDGVYVVTAKIHLHKASSPHHGVIRLMKNTTEIPGSFAEDSTVSSDANEVHVITSTCLITLATDDSISLQLGGNIDNATILNIYDDANLPDPTTAIYASIIAYKVG